MPPKGSSTRARGRGRGRGRGGATDTARPAAADESPALALALAPSDEGQGQGQGQEQEQEREQAEDVKPVLLADVPMTDAPPADTLVPSEQQTTAPPAQLPPPIASAPAASSSAARPPPQRLDSLRRPAATASPASPASPALSAAVRGRKQLLAQPRAAIRRSRADREALEAAQAARRAEQTNLANALGARRGGDRGRGRGRGGFMGDNRRRDAPIASGPFSSGTVNADGSSRRRAGPSMGGYGAYGPFGGGVSSPFGTGSPAPGAASYTGGGGSRAGGSGGGGGASSSRIKTEGGENGAGGSAYHIPGRFAEDVSSDEDVEEEGRRKNIDTIDLISSDEDETRGKTLGMQGLPPIRVSRVDHKDRRQPVTAEKSKQPAVDEAVDDVDSTAEAPKRAPAVRTPSPTITRKGKQRAKDVEFVSTERKWKGAWTDGSESESEVAVKEEDADVEDGATWTNARQAMPLDDQGNPIIKESPDSKRKRMRVRRPPVPELQTLEERQEYERHMTDLDILRQELGEISIPGTSQDAQGDSAMQDGHEEVPRDKRADRVYLFQFPPVLPDLSVKPQVKKEPDASPDLARKDKPSIPDTIDLDGNGNTNAGSSNTASAPIKVEDSVTAAPAPLGQPHLASGAVGKLRVYASGRATLDWGGTALQMGMGTDMQFLQDVVVAKLVEEKQRQRQQREGQGEDVSEPDPAAFGGHVTGLGQIRGKFVVTPDWAEIV